MGNFFASLVIAGIFSSYSENEVWQSALTIPSALDCIVVSDAASATVTARISPDAMYYAVSIGGSHVSRTGPSRGKLEEILIDELFTAEIVGLETLVLSYARPRRSILIEIPLLEPSNSIIDDRLVFFSDPLSCTLRY
jgi:hypothetical protein